MPLVVADASPLIALDRVGRLGLLPSLFPEVAAPPAVVAEFGRRPGWLAEVRVERAAQRDVLLDLRFGAGEAEALALALERPGTTLVVDERRARAFALRHGIEVVGTAGLVVRAKQVGLVAEVRPVLDALLASGFRLSDDLYRAVLANVGEDE